jgi:Domain of unknown function (DUF222)
MSGVTPEPSETVLSVAEYIEAVACHQRSAAQLALATARLETSQLWALDGSVTIKAFIKHHCRMSGPDAGRLLAEGRFLTKFPAIADAAVSSVLSASQVSSIRVHVPKLVEPLLDDQQGSLVETLAPLNVRDTETCMQRWQQYAEAIIDKPQPKPVERELRHNRLPDGSSSGTFSLDAAGAEELERALGTASRWDGPGDNRPGPRKRGDALFDILAFFNKNHDRPGTRRHRPHIELVIDTDRHGTRHVTTTDGHPVETCTADAWMCDAIYHRIMTADTEILDYGHAVYSFPLTLFRAIARRDRGCRFPGCDRPVRWSDCHHVKYYEHDGDTSLDNGCLLCSRHHHLIHRPGWDLKLLPDGTVVVTTPDGTTLTSRPPPRLP